MSEIRDALMGLVQRFRFEITFHVSVGQPDDEPQPQGDVFSVAERRPSIGFEVPDVDA